MGGDSMKLWELIKSALASLWNNKTRTALSMLGIIIGITSVIVIIGFSEGQTKSIEEEFASSGANRLTVSTSTQVSRSTLITLEDVATIQVVNADRVKRISPVMSATGRFALNREDYTISTTGSDGDYDEIFDLEMVSGSYF